MTEEHAAYVRELSGNSEPSRSRDSFVSVLFFVCLFVFKAGFHCVAIELRDPPAFAS